MSMKVCGCDCGCGIGWAIVYEQASLLGMDREVKNKLEISVFKLETFALLKHWITFALDLTPLVQGCICKLSWYRLSESSLKSIWSLVLVCEIKSKWKWK